MTPGYEFHYTDSNDHEFLRVVRPGAFAASYLIRRDVIRRNPDRVLMAKEANGWRNDVAFPSLHAALLSIHALTEAELVEADRKVSTMTVWNSGNAPAQESVLLIYPGLARSQHAEAGEIFLSR
jgi:hypothetical protein